MFLLWLDDESNLVCPGITHGLESGFGGLMNGGPAFGSAFYTGAIYNDTTWDWTLIGVDTVRNADAVNPGGVNAYDPDMRPFQEAGGKVIQYHGFSDPLLPATLAPAWYDTLTGFYSALNKTDEVGDFTDCSWYLEWGTAAVDRVLGLSTTSLRTARRLLQTQATIPCSIT